MRVRLYSFVDDDDENAGLLLLLRLSLFGTLPCGVLETTVLLIDGDRGIDSSARLYPRARLYTFVSMYGTIVK